MDNQVTVVVQESDGSRQDLALRVTTDPYEDPHTLSAMAFGAFVRRTTRSAASPGCSLTYRTGLERGVDERPDQLGVLLDQVVGRPEDDGGVRLREDVGEGDEDPKLPRGEEVCPPG